MYSDNPELLESYYSVDELYYQPRQYGWIGALIFALAVLTPISFCFLVAKEHLATCLLAYLNSVIILVVSWRFLRKRTLAAMLPVMSLPYLFLALPLAIIFFAIFYPNQAYYGTIHSSHSMFDAGARTQLCVLLFLTGYLLVISIVLRNESYVESRSRIESKGVGYVVATFVSSVIFFDAFSKVKGLPEFAAYLAEGFYKYLNGLVFIVGAFFKRFPKVIEAVVIILVTIVVVFYTVGNNRARAVRCVAFLALGLFLFSGYSRKTKLIFAICLCLAFPVYVTIANTTRRILGTVGFEEGFSYRLKILKEWRRLPSERPAAAFTFGRLFFAGGHSIIARTPAELPYRSFRPHPFVREVFASLVPGALYYRPYYRGTQILVDYDFYIVPGQTSIEVSMIGGLWLMGGYLPVFFGGIAVGLLHGLLVKILQRSWRASEMKGLIYFSILLPGIFWAPNLDVIEHWRDTVYRLTLAVFVYWLLKPVVVERGPDDLMLEQA